MLNPSSAEKWMNCPGSIAMEQGLVDEGNDYADEGTAGHLLAAECFAANCDPVHFLLRTILVGRHVASDWDGAMWLDEDEPVADGFEVRNTYKVNDNSSMIAAVRKYVQAVRTMTEGALWSQHEHRVPIGAYTGEEGVEGTSDYTAVVDEGKELQVHDLKLGHVAVSPERNKQEMIYALGVLEDIGISGLDESIERVRLVIHQPNVFQDPSEWTCTVDELRAFGEEVRNAAGACLLALKHRQNWFGKEYSYLQPSEDACRWCLAKATCPKLQAFVEAAVAGDFEDLDEVPTLTDVVKAGTPILVPREPASLGAALDAVPLIETWAKAVRAAADKVLREGGEVPSPKGGYKLVRGKAGARYWGDPEEAEKVMRSMRLGADVMYDKSLISPTAAEKLHTAGAITARQWPRLEAIIKKPEAGLSVAPVSDKRPAQSAVAKSSDFEDLPPTAPPQVGYDDGSDLG